VGRPLAVAAQVDFEGKSSTAIHHILDLSGENTGAFNTGFETVDLRRLTLPPSPPPPGAGGALPFSPASESSRQGLTLATFQLNVSTFCGIR
jgi:hypothetical protein